MHQAARRRNQPFTPIRYLIVGLLALSCSQEQPRQASSPTRSNRTSSKNSNSKNSRNSSTCNEQKFKLLAGETYEKDIAPLINAKCSWCHSPDAAANRRRTPYLNTLDLVKTNAARSIQEMNDNSMPPNNVIPKLASGDAALVQAWVNGGMIQGTALVAPKAITYNGFIKEYLRRNCTGCHSAQGGQAPDLSTFDAAKALAAASINSMTQRRMPPGLPTVATAGAAHLQDWMNQGLLLDEPIPTPSPSMSETSSPAPSPEISASPTMPVVPDLAPDAAEDCID